MESSKGGRSMEVSPTSRPGSSPISRSMVRTAPSKAADTSVPCSCSASSMHSSKPLVTALLALYRNLVSSNSFSALDTPRVGVTPARPLTASCFAAPENLSNVSNSCSRQPLAFKTSDFTYRRRRSPLQLCHFDAPAKLLQTMTPTSITSGCRKHPDRALLTLMCAF